MSSSDEINHPSHYSYSDVETVTAIEAWYPTTEVHKAMAVKYLSRAGHKDDEIRDLKKALWWVDRAIRFLEK